MKPDVPLSTGDIAKLCHVTYRCVLQWIDDGKMKSYRTPGGRHRVSAGDFMDFLKRYNMPFPEGEGALFRRKRILIVDDDKEMVSSIKRMLVLENSYDIDLAFDGFEAGRKLVEFNPDLVILDFRMPGMDGCEVTRVIKQSMSRADIKVIVVSAYLDRSLKDKVIALGADAYMPKPFDADELLKKIEELL